MICNYEQADIVNLSEMAHKQRVSLLNKSIMLDSHLNELLSMAYTDDSLFQGTNSLYKKGYPRTIKVAPSVQSMFDSIQSISSELARVEIEFADDARLLYQRKKELILSVIKPVKVIELEAPIEGNFWWGDTLKGINLRPGLVDNDWSKRYPGFIGGNEVHGIIGGATGQGKSVTLNALLVPLLYEYPPWELQLWMTDMKVLEFMRYGGAYKSPHIRALSCSQSPDYIRSVLEVFDKEMNMLYAIGGIMNSQSLAGIRSYLDMYIPRNFMLTDELSQLYAIGSPKTVAACDVHVQSIAKLGRALGYHFVGASQNFSGTFPDSVLKQFAVGVGVGCDEDTSESVIGNNGAKDLLDVVGYCIINQARLAKKKEKNVRYKVAYWPDDTDEDKEAFQGFLKRPCDVAKSLGVADIYSTVFYNEQLRIDYKELPANWEYSAEGGLLESIEKGQQLMCPVSLGSIMRFTGVAKDIGRFNWCYGKGENVYIHSRSTEDIKYMVKLLADNISIGRDDVSHTMIVGNYELYKKPVEVAREDMSGVFPVTDYLSSALSRQALLRYHLKCKALGSEPTVEGYLDTVSATENFKSDLELLNSIGSDLLYTATTVNNIAEPDAGSIEEKLRKSGKLPRIIGLGNMFNTYEGKKNGMYLSSTDFVPNMFWIFGPQQNDSIWKYGSPDEKFLELLSVGPQVGIFFVVVTDDCRMSKGLISASKHTLVCIPQEQLESYGFDKYVDESGIGIRYSKFEGLDKDTFYCKKYVI